MSTTFLDEHQKPMGETVRMFVRVFVRVVSVRVRHAQSQCTGDATGCFAITDHHESRIAFACDAGEPHALHTRERWRAVEHDEGEHAAAEQLVGAPCAAPRLARTNHHEAIAQPGPRLRGGRASCVHPRHPSAAGQHARHRFAQERGAAGTHGTDDLRDAPAWNSTPEGLIE